MCESRIYAMPGIVATASPPISVGHMLIYIAAFLQRAEYNGVMAEEGKKDEKFDFTPQGEAVGFVTLDQARHIAIERAREESGNYGPSWQSVPMVFEVVDAEETEDDYSLSLSFRPDSEFTAHLVGNPFLAEPPGVYRPKDSAMVDGG